MKCGQCGNFSETEDRRHTASLWSCKIIICVRQLILFNRCFNCYLMKTLKIFLLLFIFSKCTFGDEGSKIDRLKTFAKIYGYVKYFHPSDESSKINWDKFAIYGCSKIDKCTSDSDLLQTLTELFQPVAPSMRIYRTADNVKFDIASITPPDAHKFRITYWQHLGVSKGMKYQSGPYASVRVN